MIVQATTDFYLNYLKDDPVRPHIPASKRIQNNAEVYVLESDTGEIQAMICTAFTSDIPKTEEELFTLSDNNKKNAIFYTVWSYVPGAGRDLVLGVSKLIKEKYNCERYVTLSPKTEMARKFHIKNGAFELQENADTVNYEYPKEAI